MMGLAENQEMDEIDNSRKSHQKNADHNPPVPLFHDYLATNF
jgi:hypothetical protein